MTTALPYTTQEAAAAIADAIRPQDVRVYLEAKRARQFARTPSKVDITGAPKPKGHVYVNKQTVWFTVYRKSMNQIGCTRIGQWLPITRRHPSNAKRRATIAKFRKAQTELTGAAWLRADAERLCQAIKPPMNAVEVEA